MARPTTCMACGKSVEPGDYCSYCGTSLDEEAQERASREHSAVSERRYLAQQCDRLVEFAESAGERDALARIQQRIEDAPLDRFMDDE